MTKYLVIQLVTVQSMFMIFVSCEGFLIKIVDIISNL